MAWCRCSSRVGKHLIVVNGGSKLVSLVGVVCFLHSSHGVGIFQRHPPENGSSSSENVGERVKVFAIQGNLEGLLNRSTAKVWAMASAMAVHSFWNVRLQIGADSQPYRALGKTIVVPLLICVGIYMHYPI